MGMKRLMKSTLAAALAVGLCMSATGGLQPVHAEERSTEYTNDDRAFLANRKYHGDIWYDGEYKKHYGEKKDFFTYYVENDNLIGGYTLVMDYWMNNGQDTLFVPDTVDGIKIVAVSFKNVVAENIVLADGIKEASGVNSDTIFLGEDYGSSELMSTGLNGLRCKKIKVSKKNENFKSIGGVLFSKNGKELKYYPPKRKNARYIIPKGTKRIGKEAFAYLYNLKEIVIPSSVKHIENAFYDSLNLKSFVLKGKKTVIPIDSGFIYLDCDYECEGECKSCYKEVTVKVPAGSVMRKKVKDKRIKYVTTKK